MDPKQDRGPLSEFLDFTLGAVTLGAEKLAVLGKNAAKQTKKIWDEHEDDRRALEKKLIASKEKLVCKFKEMGKEDTSFDSIVANLDKLSEEELEKLKSILNHLD